MLQVWLSNLAHELTIHHVNGNCTVYCFEAFGDVIVTSYAHVFWEECYMSSNPLVLGEKHGSWLGEMTSIILFGQFGID